MARRKSETSKKSAKACTKEAGKNHERRRRNRHSGYERGYMGACPDTTDFMQELWKNFCCKSCLVDRLRIHQRSCTPEHPAKPPPSKAHPISDAPGKME
ncbi:unnamed protein product [Strongylus vulgaris]|uniref:Uncharacterized protein n=1 Tax=Strongylus vulgaris TaxID=40348 RepID=A0A3P7J894_STRVU|nr:unnamed protein product [Strongylus vulgaris]